MAELPLYTKVWHADTYSDIDAKKPELSVAGKLVCITGGGSGIGAATAESFASAGAGHIVILGRTERTLLSTKATVEKKHKNTKVSTIVADVGNSKSIEAAFEQIAKIGKIDVFVSNAGHLSNYNPVTSSALDEWWTSFEVNIRGSIAASAYFVKNAAKDAVLINVSSAGCHVPPGAMAGFSAYSASKLGAARVFEYIQFEHPELRVFNLQPGIIEATPIATKAAEQSGYHFPQQDTVELPANFMVWLCSPEAAFLTGRFVWANWDVKELKAKEEELKANPALLTMGLIGWP